jgi:hypothetical protein
MWEVPPPHTHTHTGSKAGKQDRRQSETILSHSRALKMCKTVKISKQNTCGKGIKNEEERKKKEEKKINLNRWQE